MKKQPKEHQPTPFNTLTNWRQHLASITLCLLILILPLHANGEESVTNFGVGFSLANYPTPTEDDYLSALYDVMQAGDHSGFIWHWDNQHTLENRLIDVASIKIVGLKTFVQISVGMLGVPNPPEGYTKSFADPESRALYLENVTSFAHSHPDYINLATEANFMHYWALEEWNNYKSLYNEAYDIIKEISPETKVGVSYHYGLFIWQRQFFLPYDLGPHDYIAFTSYPSWLVDEGHYASIEDISPDWYAIPRIAYPDTPIIFSEIGWSSSGTSTPEQQALFAQHLPRLMSGLQPELLSWVFLHDTTFFNPDWANHLAPRDQEIIEELDINLSLLFTRFNAMGLKTQTGAIKPVWDTILKLDFSQPELQ